MLENGMRRDHEHIVRGFFHENFRLGRHSGKHAFGLFQRDRDAVLLHVPHPVVRRLGVFVHFDDGPPNVAFTRGVRTHVDGLPLVDVADFPFVNVRGDLQFVGVRQAQERLTFADHGALADEELGGAEPVRLVHVEDLAVGRGFDGAELDLLFNVLEFGFVLLVNGGRGGQIRAGLFDVRVVILALLVVREFFQDVNVQLGGAQTQLGFAEGENVRFQLGLGDETFFVEDLTVLEVLGQTVAFLFGLNLITDEFLEVDFVRAVLVFLLRDERRGKIVLGGLHFRLALSHFVDLGVPTVDQGRTVKHRDDVALFDLGPFIHDPRDHDAAGAADLALHVLVLGATDVAADGDLMAEFGHSGVYEFHRSRISSGKEFWPQEMPNQE